MKHEAQQFETLKKPNGVATKVKVWEGKMKQKNKW
jgi:hypothetical protein